MNVFVITFQPLLRFFLQFDCPYGVLQRHVENWRLGISLNEILQSFQLSHLIFGLQKENIVTESLALIIYEPLIMDSLL